MATLGRVRGRGPQAKRSGKDSPEGAYQPRPPACRRLPDGRERALPPRHPPATPRRNLRENGKGQYRSAGGTAVPAGERKGPKAYRSRDRRTWQSLRKNGKGENRSSGRTDGCLVRPGGRAHRSIGRYLCAQKGLFLSTPCHQIGPMESDVVPEWTGRDQGAARRQRESWRNCSSERTPASRRPSRVHFSRGWYVR